MPQSALLALSLAVQKSLEMDLPALVDRVNADNLPEYPIAMPTQVDLGVRVEMLKKKVNELPALACGCYVRETHEATNDAISYAVMPYTIDVYLGHKDPTALYIHAQKWALALDLWAEEFASLLIPGMTSDEAPNIEISNALEERDGTYRQLVSATGTFYGME